LRYRVALVLFILAIFQQQHLFLISRHALQAKYSPTNFDVRSDRLSARSWTDDDEDAHFQDELIANRASWQVLGAGWEGKVFKYEDYVIKTFTPGRSPFRNCAPGASDKWPTEIPASLQFGGFSTPTDISTSNDTSSGFLPVKAHFMAATSPGQPAEWHMVTPLVKGGNLEKLAQQLSKSEHPQSFREVDTRYRPAFNKLLQTIEGLHKAGYCHDDMKPGNIFIQDESQWVLGDLGNLREVSHPYHSSELWKDNAQLQDCRANDVVRALKSYLQFVQSSAGDGDDFNAAFFHAQEPTSRLFWWTLADAPSMSAGELRQRSLVEYPEAISKARLDERFSKPVQHGTFLGLFSRRLGARQAVNRALVTRMGEKSARWWGMVWLFGVPDSELCSV
jgi:hypothetical protein